MTGKQRVGLIGVGLMGHGIGKNILKNGYSLNILGHRNRKPIESLLAQGAEEADSAREIAERSDLVILCVTGSPQVESVVLGEDGLRAGLHDGTVIADCSTAEPESTLMIAARVAESGGRFVDVPMIRTPTEAEAGTLGLITGGDPATLDEIRPVLECFADTFVHAGGVGAAHRLKLINNFIGLGTAAVVCEAVVAAAKGGVGLQALHDLVTSGGSNSVMFERVMTNLLKNDDSVFQFAIRNAQKDLRYYTSMTQQQPVTSFIAESVHQTFVMAETLGYGDRFVPYLMDMLAQVNSADIKR